MQGRALLSKPSSHCIDQGSVLHVHPFRTTHIRTALIRVLYFMCTHSVLHMFALHFCALDWQHLSLLFFPLTQHFFQCTSVHCFVASMCTAFVIVLCCMCTHFALRASSFCQKVVTGYANAAKVLLFCFFYHVLHFIHTYSELPGTNLENCTHKMICGL